MKVRENTMMIPMRTRKSRMSTISPREVFSAIAARSATPVGPFTGRPSGPTAR